MSEMIERLAEAAYEYDTGRSDWDEETEWMNEAVCAHWRGLVRWLLGKLREPTDAMIDAADDAGDKRDHVRIMDSRAEADVEWRAMIDAALDVVPEPVTET